MRAVRGVGDTLVKEHYATSFRVDVKRKRYRVVWKKSGLQFAHRFYRLWRESVRCSVAEYRLDSPAIDQALVELLLGSNLN